MPAALSAPYTAPSTTPHTHTHSPVTSLLRAAPQGMQRKYKLKKYAISLKGAELQGVVVPLPCPRPDMSIIFHNANKAEADDVVRQAGRQAESA